MRRLPGILATIAEVAGEEAALLLAQRLGGTEIKPSGRKNSTLSAVVGPEAAAKIAEALGSGKVVIPMAGLRGAGGRRARAAQMFENQATERQVALACDMHGRTARRLRARLKAAANPKSEEEEQLPLFPPAKR